MRRGDLFGGIVAIAIAGCGTFLGANGDDDEPTGGGGTGDASDGNASSSADATGASDGTSSNGDASADASVDAGPLRVFASQENYPGNNVQNVDCQALADGAALGGKWVAWLSFPGKDAVKAISGDGPWKTLGGDLVAANKTELTSGKLAHPIDRDQNDMPRIGDVWTGTATDGTATQDTCDGWRQVTDLTGTFGQSGATDGIWTDWETAGCDETKGVYCFEIPKEASE